MNKKTLRKNSIIRLLILLPVTAILFWITPGLFFLGLLTGALGISGAVWVLITLADLLVAVFSRTDLVRPGLVPFVRSLVFAPIIVYYVLYWIFTK